MKALRTWFLLYMLAIILQGCAALGMTPPQTPSQKLYTGLGICAQAEAVATNLLNAKMISSAKASEIQDAARITKKAIDEYFSLGTVEGKPMTAVEVLALVNKSLLTLETFLAEKK